MNVHPMNPSPSPSAPPKDLFFRLADRLQIDACLEAIEQEGKSVILHGISPGLLDHYSQILVQRLRKRLPDTPTEIFFPTHTEALIARFNDLLEDVSVDAATQNQGSQAPQKLWIVHDASALPEHELKLLLRLLQHLPGARVSAVLVLNGQAAGVKMEVRGSLDHLVTLLLPIALPLAVGDRLKLTAGCNRELPTCKRRFSNVPNFRGEPWIPDVAALKPNSTTSSVNQVQLGLLNNGVQA